MSRYSPNHVLLQAIFIALVVGAAVPALWIGLAGYSYATTVVDKAKVDQMTSEELDEWIKANGHTASRIEHIRAVPRFICEHPRGYLQAAASIFLVVFVLNLAFTWQHNKET